MSFAFIKNRDSGTGLLPFDDGGVFKAPLTYDLRHLSNLFGIGTEISLNQTFSDNCIHRTHKFFRYLM